MTQAVTSTLNGNARLQNNEARASKGVIATGIMQSLENRTILVTDQEKKIPRRGFLSYNVLQHRRLGKV